MLGHMQSTASKDRQTVSAALMMQAGYLATLKMIVLKGLEQVPQQVL